MKYVISVVLISFLFSMSTFAQSGANHPKVKAVTLKGNGGPGAQKSQGTAPETGNGGPGGGNIIVDPPASPELVDQYVNGKNLKFFLKGLVRSLQYKTITEPYMYDKKMNVLKKVFSKNSENKTIYQMIDEVDYHVLMKGPCYDSKHNEKDAYFQEKPHLVCLSGERISKSVTASNIEKKLYPLMLHEISHYMGLADELPGEATSEAHTFQDLIPVDQDVSSDFYSAVNFLISNAKLIDKSLDQIAKKIKAGKSTADICGDLIMTTWQITSLSVYYSSASNRGAAVLPLGFHALISTGLSAELMIAGKTFCSDLGDKEIEEAKTKFASVDGHALLRKFIEPEYSGRLLGSIQVKFGRGGNTDDLQEGLSQIRSQLNEIDALASGMPTH